MALVERARCLGGPGRNFLTISNIAGFNTFRNFELWFQQNLWEDKISLRLGQLAADSEFVISDYGSAF